MRPSDALRIAIRRIRSRLLESLLMVMGVALGAGAIASTLSLYAGVSSSMGGERQLREITVKVPEAGSPRATSVQPVITGARDEGSLVPEDINAVMAVSVDIAHGYFAGLFSRGKGSGELVGIVVGDYFAAFGLRAAEGTIFSPADEISGARVAVLGARKARFLFPDGKALGSTVKLIELDYRVVGVLAPATGSPDPDRPMTDDLAFIPLRSSVVYEKMRSVPSITFVARSTESILQAAAEVRAYFDARHGRGTIEVTAGFDEIEAERRRIRGVLVVLLAFAGAGLLVASINMLNVLLSRVARRLRATGIAVALGERKAGVFRSNLLESLLLGLAGSVAGVLCSLGLNAALQQLFAEGSSDDLKVTLTPKAALMAAGMALAVNLLFAVYPAWRAARMTAADAIRAE